MQDRYILTQLYIKNKLQKEKIYYYFNSKIKGTFNSISLKAHQIN